VKLNKGKNDIRVVAKRGKVQVEDVVSYVYQAEKWGKPAKLLIEKIKEENGVVTLQAKLLDDKNVQCLDAANWIRFELAGDGQLIDNLGTS
jgi:beta-galactosidase